MGRVDLRGHDCGDASKYSYRSRRLWGFLEISQLDCDIFDCCIVPHVLCGGNLANVRAMKNVLENGPPQNLWNIYGPIECMALVTLTRVTLEETSRERISIGSPIGETVLVLLDENQNTIRDSGRRGEIYLEGSQQSLGYLNRLYETSQSFVYLARKRMGFPGEGAVRLYRTGDMAEWCDATYLLDFAGRTNN
ncbi:Male sterility NAD-binding [Penicillium coprophilum]|uniref:Male sterility NAD-binding n=1 Tax=Penicillium coprophilum TaxID=36646 RepID=UPI0023929667|nr:Male sterility NAD-binding [Penicillium coprophilum]KAJ5164746.1 Male sterility NAD-binding [Penicillium coprophilum]